ncbi:MAG: hypothetical protein V4713_02875 [Pseudomonadota bacterium]
MNRAAAVAAPASAQVRDLMQHRLERALRERVRYRYVQPLVVREANSFRIQSPCCSRNVDPNGGLIDIALLVPHESGRWCLCARDHANSTWVSRFQDQPLDTLLDLLCVDNEREFWP